VNVSRRNFHLEQSRLARAPDKSDIGRIALG
jgi:hypothetical protein